MSIWLFLQILVNVMFLVGFLVMWFRLKRPPQEDPRLSRGLQLLQSKISVLEDLSDRTEVQFKQLNTMLENKMALVQRKIEQAEVQIKKIDMSMSKSMEVAEIFQDKIPHEEIIERQNTIKYVQAARMAHEGYSIEEIMDEVDLPKGEVEFITKVNKDELMFDESQLPPWVNELKGETDIEEESEGDDELNYELDAVNMIEEDNFESAFQVPEHDYESLKKVGEEFRRACQDFEEKQAQAERDSQVLTENTQKVIDAAKTVTHKIMDSAEEIIKETGHIAKETGHKAVEASVEAGKKLEAELKPVLRTQMEKIRAKSAQGVAKTKAQVAKSITAKSKGSTAKPVNSEPKAIKAAAATPEKPLPEEPIIKKVVFPRIDVNDNLS